MNKLTFLILVLLSLGMVACEEVAEVTEYDNWQERNEAFIDSLASLAGNNYIATEEHIDQMPTNQFFAIEVTSAGTDQNKYYIYCKKLTNNSTGVRPLYTESVRTYYYGSTILGKSFDGCFTGYTATDRGVLDGNQKLPTAFDSPVEFSVKALISGWTTALQYMREGERWMIYIPYQCGYGDSDSGSIPAYSALTFDVILDKVIQD